MASELIVIFVLVLVNGFFAAAEIGVLSIRRSRLQELADEGRRGARAALTLREFPEQFLATVQVGITFVGATASAVGGATLATPLAGWFAELGLQHGADKLALAVVITLVSVLSIVLGELVPKSLALRSSERVSLLVARPLRALSTIARPVVWTLTALSNLVLRPFRDHTSFMECRVSSEEIQSLVEEASKAGSLSPAASDIASRALDLDDLSIAAVLIPRVEVVSVRVDATRDEVWALIKQHPHARYPVIEQTLDTVDGYVTARDLVTQIVDEEVMNVRAAMRPIPTFTERTRAVEVLRSLQEQRAPLAAIIDEHGMTAGIVTITDIAEELIGDVLDEYQRPDEAIRIEGPRVALVRASTTIQDINRALDTDLAVSDDYATLSGFLMFASQRIMRPDETITVGSVEFEVLEATPRQVKLVRLHRREAEPPADA